jgi:hypothetical protein
VLSISSVHSDYFPNLCVLKEPVYKEQNMAGENRPLASLPQAIDEWKLVEERLQKRLSSWKGKLLFLGGLLIVINSVLSNMVLHMISSFLLPKGVLHKLDY